MDNKDKEKILEDLNKFKNKILEEKKTEENEVKEIILQEFLSSNQIKPSELKTTEQIIDEFRNSLNENYSKYNQDLKNGIELFIQKTKDEELAQLETVLKKLFEESKKQPGSESQEEIQEKVSHLSFLEEIAKRELSENHYTEANSMFHFILSMEIFYSPAWIGCAVAEQLAGRQEEAEQIYETALIILEDDDVIRLYAGEFFLLTGRTERAKEILQNAKTHLQETGESNTEMFKEIEQLIAH
jgi:tetratricopeptide (TPR) repeat protein